MSVYLETPLNIQTARAFLQKFCEDQPQSYQLKPGVKATCVNPGTIHEVDQNGSILSLPCMSSGLCVKSADVQSEWNVHPILTILCPCRLKTQDERADQTLREELGVQTIIDAPTAQLLAARKALRKGKSIYVKNKQDATSVAHFILTGQSPRVFHGVDFSDYILKTVKDEMRWKPYGVYCVLGFDKLPVSEAMCRRVNFLIERAARSNDLRLVLTTWKETDDLAAMFGTIEQALETANYLSEFHQVVV